MDAPILVPCLVSLRQEFNRLAPNRDKGADGWIGDAAHQRESSDHNPDETGRTPYSDADSVNEVHAIDIDKDLGGGLDLDVYVERIRLNHFHAEDDRLQNIIWRGRICSRSWGWTWRTYTGPSQHFDHAHFSARYTSAQEADTRPWGVYEEDDDMTPAEFAAMLKDPAVATQMRALPWQYKGGGIPTGTSTLNVLNEVVLSARAQKLRDEAILAAVTDHADTAEILRRVDARADQLAASVDQVDEAVWSRVASPEASVEQKAQALRTLLGDQAADVGALLATPAGS